MGLLPIILLVTLCSEVSAKKGVLWRPVTVSQSSLTTGSRETKTHTFSSSLSSLSFNTSCSRLCQAEDWCDTWCRPPPPEETCLLFAMYVVYGYEESDLTDAIPCFTSTPKDYAVGATISGAPPRAGYPNRGKENLVDGIYRMALADCYHSNDLYDPWFKVYLGYLQQVKGIKMVLQHDAKVEDMYDIKCIYGKENLTDIDFSGYKSCGYFSGPGSPNEEVLFEMVPPVLLQYIVIQRVIDRNSCNPGVNSNPRVCQLVMCHLEIHEKFGVIVTGVRRAMHINTVLVFDWAGKV